MPVLPFSKIDIPDSYGLWETNPAEDYCSFSDELWTDSDNLENIITNWLSGWNYRKPITLSRASGAVSDYQMKVLIGESSGAAGEDVDCDGLCLSNFNDIRFTTADGYTLLNYWIESITGSSPNRLATIWVKFDSIGVTATSFYMYYGKADAIAYSNGPNTFIHFDDSERGVNGDTIGGDWSEIVPHCHISTAQVYDGTRSIQFIANATNHVQIRRSCAIGNIAIQVRMRLEAGATFYALHHGNGIKRTHLYISPGTNGFHYYDGTSHDIGNFTADTWTKVEIRNFNFTTGKYDVLKDDVMLATDVSMWANSSYNNQVDFFNYAYNKNAFIDNFIVRQFLPVEPTWGVWGSQQTKDWLSGWSHRKAFTLSRPSGSVVNYQLKLLVGESSGAVGESVDCGGLCLSNFNDIRFTRADGISLLSYWIETTTGTTPNQLATIWIKFPFIDASDTTFYMYYGNADAIAYSNGSNTFSFFDHFDGASINTDLWTGDTGSTSQSSSILTLTGLTGGVWKGIQTKSTFSSEHRWIGQIRFEGRGTSWQGNSAGFVSGINIVDFLCFHTMEQCRYTGGAAANVVINEGSYHQYQVRRISASQGQYLEDSTILATLTGNSLESLPIALGSVGGVGYRLFIDWIFVASYVVNEPVWGSWNAQESVNITALEDARLNLSAYYQSLEDLPSSFETWANSLEDLKAKLEAASYTLEDLKSFLATYYHSSEDVKASFEASTFSFDDLKTKLEAAKYSLDDFKVSFSAYSLSTENFATNFETWARTLEDAKAFFQTIATSYDDLPASFEAYLQSTEDLKSRYEASKYFLENLNSRLEVASYSTEDWKAQFEVGLQFIEDLQSQFEAVKYTFDNVQVRFEASSYSLDDLQSYLAAFSLALDNLKVKFEASSYSLDDLQSFFSAYYESLDDAKLNLASYLQSTDDLKTKLEASSYSIDDFKTSFITYGQAIGDLKSYLATNAQTLEDFKSYFITNAQSLEDFKTLFETWGQAFDFLKTNLAAYHQSLDDDFGVQFEAISPFGNGKFDFPEFTIHGRGGGKAILEFPEFTISGSGQQEVATYFTANCIYGVAPLRVQFLNFSFGEIISYDWSFGDNSNHSNEEHPIHIYEFPGLFTVTLSVERTSGLTEIFTRTFLVTVLAESSYKVQGSVLERHQGYKHLIRVYRRDNGLFVREFETENDGTFDNELIPDNDEYFIVAVSNQHGISSQVQDLIIPVSV